MPIDDGETSAVSETSIPTGLVVAAGTSMDATWVISETMLVTTLTMDPASTVLDDTNSPKTEVRVDSGRSLVMEATTVGSMTAEAVDETDARIEVAGSLTPTVAVAPTPTRSEVVSSPTDAVAPADTGPADTERHTASPSVLIVQLLRPAEISETGVVTTTVIGSVTETVALAETSTKLDESPRPTDAVTPPETGSTTLAVIPGMLDKSIEVTSGVLFGSTEGMLTLTATVSPAEMVIESDPTKVVSPAKLVGSIMLAGEVTTEPMTEATSEVRVLSTEATSEVSVLSTELTSALSWKESETVRRRWATPESTAEITELSNEVGSDTVAESDSDGVDKTSDTETEADSTPDTEIETSGRETVGVGSVTSEMEADTKSEDSDDVGRSVDGSGIATVAPTVTGSTAAETQTSIPLAPTLQIVLVAVAVGTGTTVGLTEVSDKTAVEPGTSVKLEGAETNIEDSTDISELTRPVVDGAGSALSLEVSPIEAGTLESRDEIAVILGLASGREAETVAPALTGAMSTLTQTAIPLVSTVHPAGAVAPGLTDVVYVDVIYETDSVSDRDAVTEAPISGTDTELAGLASGSEAETVAPALTGATKTLTQTAIPFVPTVDVIYDIDSVPDRDAVIEALISGTDTEVAVTGVLRSVTDTESVAPAETGSTDAETHTTSPLPSAVQPDGTTDPDATEVV
ncbi:uncharacterized protein AB675_7646 [Cyphellophora attinorum]|uniref:Uncharacterized protein n=1 Tax=Cyphellophora attinorum TaxID=1664694 RepID=A0A0N1HQL4_9EURO|nr:uncharacterized protein AB675_7646 [Phialophora attinorum]KPI40272.1 hypothetical protein AB675_7646 [Phialophora attinorum]